MHQFIPYNTLALQSLCRMICVQMKIISAAEHVRRDSGRERPSVLPSWGSPRRCVLVDMEALGGELLVAGPQEALQPPGSMWLSMWHFTLLLPLHVWRVL